MGKHDGGVKESRWRVLYVDYCQPFYKRYRKFIVAAAGAAFIALQSAISDGTVTTQEWYLIATSAATAAGVWKFPNATQKKVIKSDKV